MLNLLARLFKITATTLNILWTNGKYLQILIFVEHSLYRNSTKIRQHENFPVQCICFIYESTSVKNTTDKQLTK